MITSTNYEFSTSTML